MEFPDKILGYEINDDFKETLDLILNQNRNVFITGGGGVGKSTFYEVLSHLLREKDMNCITLAPTGVAAIRVGGQTIHRFFGFDIGPLNDGSRARCVNDSAKTKLISSVNLLVIDEVSMVRADVLNAVDHVFQHVRDSQYPFGGVQVLLIGDLFQLSPIVKDSVDQTFLKDNFGGPYFFQADGFKDGGFCFKEFTKCYRQKDQIFRNSLSKIRVGEVDQKLIDYFNVCIEKYDQFKNRVGEDFVHLVSKNDTRDRINKSKLEQLPGQKYSFHCQVEGTFSPKDSILEEVLELKPNAHIMLLKNDPDGMYQNGTIATFLDVVQSEDNEGNIRSGLKIKLSNGNIITIGQACEENREYAYEKETKRIYQRTIGKLTQFPATLAWARTIHKSQSATFQKVYVDLEGGFFPPGSVYTALSRVTEYEQLGLSAALKHRHIKIDQQVTDFYKKNFCLHTNK